MSKAMAPSPTGLLNRLVTAKRSRGERVYNFGAGDPMIPMHPVILAAAQEAMGRGIVPYPDNPGLKSLREEALKWMMQAYGASYGMDEVIVTCGGKFAIYAALSALVGHGDEVLIPAPYWVSYPGVVAAVGGVVKTLVTDASQGWKISREQLEMAVSPRTKVLILNNACNPTGALYTKEEIEEILEVAERKNLMVISDEVYSELVYDGKRYISCGSYPQHRERVIVVQSCSKNFAMSGWRVGFAFGKKEIIEQMIALQSQTTTGTSLISQWAALGAIKHHKVVSGAVREILEKRRNLFVQTWNQLFEAPLESPASSIYLFVSLEQLGTEERDDSAFCEKMLKDANVALLPGTSCGMPGYVRLVFSDSEEEITEGLHALKRGIDASCR